MTEAAAQQSLPARALLEAQGEILDMMAEDAPLRDTLTRIAEQVEALAPPALCSILLMQADGKHLRPAAAPSLPETYCAAIDGLEIGPSVGSCGTASFRKEPVIVTDIATDPLWAGPRDFTLSFGLRACWSLPILDSEGAVLGTIALYYREPRAPSDRDWGLLAPSAKLVRLALATHRKEEELCANETRWTLAAEASGVGTFDVDLVTGIDQWSTTFKNILGLPEETKPDRSAFIEMIHPDDKALFTRSFGPIPSAAGAAPGYAVPGDPAPKREDLRIIRADTGEARAVVLKGRVLVNAEGAPVRGVGTMVDITPQRRHERDLAEAKFAAEEANLAKSRFLAGMSHELRTPLNAIIGFSDVIRQETFGPLSPPRYAGYIDDIHRSGEHLLSLINDVLDMAKVEAGKFELSPATLDLAALADRALTLVAPQAASGGIRLVREIAPGLAVTADDRAMRQVLVNLLSNAVKFTEAGGRVCLFAHRLDDGGLALGVEDSGVGMSKEGLATALEPFGQVQGTMMVAGNGTGLGLPIAKSLVEAHGARFCIETAPGKGTRVWSEFPPAAVTAARGAA